MCDCRPPKQFSIRLFSIEGRAFFTLPRWSIREWHGTYLPTYTSTLVNSCKLSSSRYNALLFALIYEQIHLPLREMNSVTRFGENSPLWQTSKSIWQFSKTSFSIGHKFEPTLANFWFIGHIFIGVSGKILKINLAIWSHWKGSITIQLTSCLTGLDSVY